MKVVNISILVKVTQLYRNTRLGFTDALTFLTMDFKFIYMVDHSVFNLNQRQNYICETNCTKIRKY